MEEYDLTYSQQKEFVYSLLNKLRGKEMPIFLCVGSDKFVCDSLAPIVAEMLTKKYNIPTYVYGGLDYNINATNLVQAVNYISTIHPYNPIVLIDATLDDNVGKVKLTTGGYPGMGRIIPLRKIGDLSILGVVGKKYKNFDLNSTKLGVVLNLAKFISVGVAFVCNRLMKEKVNRTNNLSKVQSSGVIK